MVKDYMYVDVRNRAREERSASWRALRVAAQDMAGIVFVVFCVLVFFSIFGGV